MSNNKSKNIAEVTYDETTKEMINLHMSYLKTVRFPLLATYFEEKGIDVSLQEIRDLFPEGDVINTPVKRSLSTNTCKRIMDEKSKKAGSECGNSSWKTAMMCKRCMDLKCGRELANKLAEQLDVELEVVTGGYDFPKAGDSKPASSRGGRGAARGRGAAARAPASRGRAGAKISVVKKMADYKEAVSEDQESSEDEIKKEESEDEDQEVQEESEDQESSEEEVKPEPAVRRRITKINKH